MQKNRINFKKLKVKLIKERKEKKKAEGKKEKSTELQKSSVEAEVYNNRKCD